MTAVTKQAAGATLGPCCAIIEGKLRHCELCTTCVVETVLAALLGARDRDGAVQQCSARHCSRSLPAIRRPRVSKVQRVHVLNETDRLLEPVVALPTLVILMLSVLNTSILTTKDGANSFPVKATVATATTILIS